MAITIDMCRVCLKLQRKSKGFKQISMKIEKLSVAEHLKDLSPKLQLPTGPGLPEMICKKCLETLLESNRLRQLAEKTDLFLSTLPVAQIEFQAVKTEIDDDKPPLPQEQVVTSPEAGADNDIKDEESMDEATFNHDTDDEPLLEQVVATELTYGADKQKPKLTNRQKHEMKMAEMEKDDKLFYCCKCPESFEQEQPVLDHYAAVHVNEAVTIQRPKVKTPRIFKFECKMCGVTCKTSFKLRRHHMLYQNTKQCTECGLFVPDQRFDIHLRQHLSTAERHKLTIECHICQKQIFSKRNMKRHLETHSTDLKYKCNECGKQLKTGAAYYGHVYYHELRRLGKTVQCPACPAKFHRHTALEIHLRSHSGEKPFACTYCDMKYADRSDLRRHIWMHTGESPYKCKVCAKMFYRKDYLRKHEATCAAKGKVVNR